jgi:hypothetical protein
VDYNYIRIYILYPSRTVYPFQGTDTFAGLRAGAYNRLPEDFRSYPSISGLPWNRSRVIVYLVKTCELTRRAFV